MPKRILGIDPGTNCGWALRDNGRYISGVWDLKPRRHEGGGMRYMRLRGYLNEIAMSGGPIDAVFYEEVRRHLGTDAAHLYGGVVATLTEFCESEKIPYQGIPVGTVKKLATGKGNANKNAMIEAANVRWAPHVCHCDNEADARWIVEAGLAGIGGDDAD